MKLDKEEVVKGMMFLGIECPRPNVVLKWLENGKKCLGNCNANRCIESLSKADKKKLTKASIKKAAKEYDERQRLEQEVKDAKRKLAEDKLADLGLTRDDLRELLR